MLLLRRRIISTRCSQASFPKRQISLAGWYRKPNHYRKSRRAERRRAIEKASRLSPASRNNGKNADSISKNNDFSLKRFLNPWNDLADIIPHEEALGDKVESTTRTFGIVAALMGSLAAALFTFNPYDGYDTTTSRELRDVDDRCNGINQQQQQQQPFSALPLKRRNTLNFIEHVTFTQHVSGTSLLVSWGVPKSQLDDIYIACCAGSFYTGVLTTVLSSIINAWLAATPPGGVRSFVRLHSWPIVLMPALLGASTSLAGTALFIGLDREHGTPVSYIGLGGTLLGGASLAFVTGRGWVHTYKSLTEAVIKKRGR
jgi:hypothetical protein